MKNIEKKRKKRSDVQFANIIEKINEGFVALDAQMNYTYVNQRASELLKRKPEDLIGKDYWDEYPEDKNTLLGQAYLRALKTQMPVEIEDYYAPSDRWFENRIYPSEEGLSIFFKDITERKRADEAMRENEERFQTLANGSPVLLWVNGLGGCEFVNREYLDFLGLATETDVRGYDWSSFVHPDDREIYVSDYLRAFEKQAVFSAEFRFRRHDGEYRWMRSEAMPRRAADGSFLGYVGATIDITVRKRAEQALREKDQQIRRITDVTPTLFLQCSSDLRYLFVNRAAAELLGFPAEEIIGKPIRQIMGDAAFEVILPHIERVLKGERVEYEAEIPYRMKGQRFMHVVYVPEFDDKGTVVGWIATVSDITERKQAEAGMRQSEERFRQAADAAGALVYEVDLLSGSTAIVHGMESIVDYDVQNTQMTSDWWHSLIHPEDLPAHLAQLNEHLVKGGPYISEYRVQSKNGGWINVQENRLVIRNDAQQAIRLIGAVTDISERKHTQVALTKFARQQGALYQFADQLQHAKSLEDVFNAALDAILRALQCDRASILRFDDAGVMRFVAWRGLSDEYRKATDGHSPWKPDEKNPEPICMNDVDTAELSKSLRTVVKTEGIGALAFIPLVFNGKLIGKFMTYYNAPHVFNEGETELSLTIARQLAVSIERKKDENTLSQSEERLRLATQAARMFTWEFDIKNQTYKVADNFAEAVGFSADLIPKDNQEILQGFIHPEDTQLIFEVLTKAIQSRSDLPSIQYRILNPESGQPVWLEMNGKIIYDSDGNPERLFGVAQNITESKQAENRLALLAEVSELLRKLENPLELTFAISKAVGEHLHVRRCLFNEIDLERDIEIVHRDYCNGVESVAGEHKVSDYSSVTSSEIAAGKTIVNYDSKTDVRTAADYERTYAQSGERAYVAVPLMRENRWVGSLWVSDDVPRRWTKEEVSLLETIAERTWTVIEKLRIDAALHESEEKYRRIVETANEGIWEIDGDTRTNFVNPRMAEMLGYTAEEMMGRSSFDFIFPEENVDGERQLALAKSGIPSKSREFRFRRKDGAELWTLVTSSPQLDPQGNFVGSTAMIADVTERKQMEDERDQLLQREQEQRASAEQAKIEAERAKAEAERELAERKLAETALGQWVETPLVDETRPAWIRYGMAVAVTALAILLRLALQPAMGDFLPLATIYGAVAFSVWFGGIGPALLSAIIGYFGSAWFIIEPHYAVVLDTKNIAGVGLFLLSNTVIIALGQAMRHAQHHAHQSARVAVERQHQAETRLREKQLVEESLRQSEALYRGIARSIPGGGVYVVNKDFQYIVAEGSVTEAFGLSREVLEGHRVDEVFQNEAAERMEERLRKNFAGETVDFETEHNGRVYWTQQAPMVDALGNIDNAIIMTIDITERKQVEEALKESERKFSLIFHKLPFAAALSSPIDGVIADINEEFVNVFGYTRQEALGKASVELGINPDSETRANILAALQKHGSVHDLELELFTKPLGARIFLLNLDMVSIGGEKYILQTAQDITERKQSEDALRRSEERFVRFMRHLPGLAWIKDVDGRYVYANAAAEKAFNTPREELYGKTDEEIFPAEVAVQFKKNDQLGLMDEKGVQVTETLEHDDGVIHYSLVNKFPIPGPDGSTVLLGGTAFDITEQKQAEEALRESEERFRAILKQATAGIVRKDTEGTFIFVNEAFCEMLGYTEAELLGKTIWQFTHQDDLEENKRLYNRAMMEGIPFKLEKRLLRKDGSILWVDVSVSPVMDATGTVQSAVAIEVDITRRKEAEGALHQLNLQLESRVNRRTLELQAANQSLREEITERQKVEDALHESRKRLQILSQRLVDVQEEERRAIARELHDRVGQSLSALNINLVILDNQISNRVPEEISARLDDSIQLVAEMITLVRDVMSDLRPPVLDDYGLEAALQSNLNAFKSRYGIDVKFEKPDQPIPRQLPGIEMTFLRIAQEALNNVARHAKAEQATLSLEQEERAIRLIVQDNGVGITSWQDANRPGSHGLTIMRERAEAFGGDLRVSSETGKGTRVEVSIPIETNRQDNIQKDRHE